MLIKRTQREARRGALIASLPPQSSGGLDRRSFLRRSGLAAGGLAALGTLPLGSIRKAEAGPPPPPGANVTIRKNVCTHCSVGCTVIAEVANGVWTRPGAGLGQPDQSRLALLQGRGGPRRRAERPPAALSDEARERPMEPHLLGSGHRRDRRQAAGDPREVGTGIGLLARLRQVHQRSRLSQPQARRVLGNQQLRSPGAHLSLHHRRRRRQYLGLRRDDQQLQRHPQRQDHHGHGRQSGRGASGFAAAHSRGQGAQPRQHDRHRSADDAHGGARDRICPRAARNPHSRPSTGCSGTSSRTAGRTRNSSASASMGWTTSARRSRSGRPTRSSASPACRKRRSSASPRYFAKQRPSTLIWAMGQTQFTVGTANVRASCILLLATGNVGHPGNGANIFRGHTNVQGATDLGLDVTTLPLYYGLDEGAWRHWCRVWEVDYDWMRLPLRQQDAHGNARHPQHALVRCHPAAEGPGRPAGHHEGHVHHGAWRQHHHAHAGSGERHREARSPGRVRSLSDDLVGALGAQERHLPAAGLHQLRDGRLTHRLQPLAAMGRADRQAGLRMEERLRRDVHARTQARLRRPDVQEHQGREWRGVGRGHSARDQSRRMVDGILRPVARAAQGAHEKSGQVRSGHVARAEGRSRSRRRLLRSAVAVLGNAGIQASRHARALQHQSAGEGRRRHLPRALRRGARRGQPALRRLILPGLGDQGRLSRVHARRAQEARLGQGPHRCRKWRSSSG